MIKEENVKKNTTKELQKKLILQANSFKTEFKKQAATAIMAAFGLIIALAWKDVIIDFINKVDFVKQYGLLLSAIILTAVSVLGIVLVSKWMKSSI